MPLLFSLHCNVFPYHTITHYIAALMQMKCNLADGMYFALKEVNALLSAELQAV